MRRPKGIKTKKSVSKRFKITATGKVLRFRAGRRHLAQTKNAKRRRRLGKVRRRGQDRRLSHHAKHAVQPSRLIFPNPSTLTD
jgi:ribosomal protein L35